MRVMYRKAHTIKNRRRVKSPLPSSRQQPPPKILTTPFVTLQRSPACSCAGGCPRCAPIQAKMKIGKPGDRYEQEADRIAEQVMNAPAPDTRRGMKESDSIQAKRSEGGSDSGVASQAQLHAATCTGGNLPQSTRDFFEPRFGQDFNNVRVHTSDDAAQMADSLNARAFTHSDNIYFNRHMYDPSSTAGRNLLAHELTHVVQQRKNVIARDEIRRRIYVNPPGRGDEIAGYLNFLCKVGHFSSTKGVITGNCPPDAALDSPSCDCVCDTVSDQSRLYSIQVVSMTNTPRFQNLYGCRNLVKRVPYPNMSPQTYGPPGKSKIKYIIMPTASGNTIRFGAFQSSGEPFYYENWRILAHELCGHGREGYPNGGQTGDRRGHDDTIKVENKIAEEHGRVARGTYDNLPRRGESFHYLVNDSGDAISSRLCRPSNDKGRAYFRWKKVTDPEIIKHYEQPYPIPLPGYQHCNLDRFRFDSANLTAEQRERLRDIGVNTKTLLRQHESGSVLATGHTDAPGSPEYNRQLGWRRAERVRYGLIHFCVPSNDIYTNSKGEDEPINPTQGPSEENRRVETEFWK